MNMRIPVEVLFTAALACVASVLARLYGLPFVTPSVTALGAVGVHYLVPLGAAIVWALCVTRGGQRGLGALVLPLVCYALVLWFHFNLKIWVPLLDVPYHDEELRQTDLALSGFVTLAFRLRVVLARYLPAMNELYMGLFMGSFYVGFCVHALRSMTRFRKVFLAALFFQGLGGLSYLVYPAIGPFIHEQGLNPVATAAQTHMLAVTRMIEAGGPAWLERAEASVLFTGLGAMPSLHAGGSFLFLWFAWKWERSLLAFHLPVFLFILIGAVTTRWHYVIDLPVGVALAGLSIYLAFLCDGLCLRIPLWNLVALGARAGLRKEEEPA